MPGAMALVVPFEFHGVRSSDKIEYKNVILRTRQLSKGQKTKP